MAMAVKRRAARSDAVGRGGIILGEKEGETGPDFQRPVEPPPARIQRIGGAGEVTVRVASGAGVPAGVAAAAIRD